ncbi:MAG: LpxI family protein [Phycisphaerales bacterium]|nr:MAG: LpxI family protein [Phycisphaerales bacterium]
MQSALTILPDPPPPPTAIGLIAGGGRLPLLIARNLRDMGHEVHGLGLANQYEGELPGMCASFREVGLLRVGSWGRILNRLGVHHAIMVGKVDKAKLMHDPFRMYRNLPDFRTLVGWFRHLRHDRRSHAVLAAIAEELDRAGVSLIDSTAPIPDQLATAGVMTRTQPTREQQADIEFVWPLLTETLRLDIGQAIAVRERDVIAVEAVEGTDRMIQRVGELCRAKGWTLCKGARAGHDRRSDVPTVGLTTIERMRETGGRCLALAAGDVIMLDREAMLHRADECGIAVVGVPHARPMRRGELREVKLSPAPVGPAVGV